MSLSMRKICGSVRWCAVLVSCAVASLIPGGVSAQDKGTLNPQPLPPLTKPESRDTRANQLFARKTTPAAMPPRSIGSILKLALREASGCRSAKRPGR
jgi:penicillin-insensitive murein endopeptidase